MLRLTVKRTSVLNCLLAKLCKRNSTSNAEIEIGSQGPVALDILNNVMQELINTSHETGGCRTERLITRQHTTHIEIKDTASSSDQDIGTSKRILDFGSNIYLGLSSHPEVVEAAKQALDRYGTGVKTSRAGGGTLDIHNELEEKISRFHGCDDAVVYATGYDANVALFPAILDDHDAILSDEFNHASIVEGIRLCKAKRLVYKHTDMEDLERKLAGTMDCRMRLIATDGIFSMDADIAPLKDIVDLADRYGALVFVDESHAAGVLGATGRGTEEHLGIEGRCHIINASLGKAIGGAGGGYTAGPRSVTDLLRQKSRPYIFSNSLSPPLVAIAIKALDIITRDASLVSKVADNAKRFHDRMREAGFIVWGFESHPVCPVLVGDSNLTRRFAQEMLSRGVKVMAATYPSVPKGTGRIRAHVSAVHSRADIDHCVDTFIDVGKQLEVIGK